MGDAEFNAFRLKAIAACVGGGSVLLALVLPEGFVGPISARVRGLFVKHTRTGNPLVDSVAEHQVCGGMSVGCGCKEVSVGWTWEGGSVPRGLMGR